MKAGRVAVAFATNPLPPKRPPSPPERFGVGQLGERRSSKGKSGPPRTGRFGGEGVESNVAARFGGLPPLATAAIEAGGRQRQVRGSRTQWARAPG